MKRLQAVLALFAPALAWSLLIMSCADEIAPDPLRAGLSFTLNPVEKTVLAGDGVQWVEGDCLSVFDGMGNARFKTESTGFTTTISGIANRTDSYTILYPYNSLASLSGGQLRTRIPSTQNPVRNGYDPSADILLARASAGEGVTMLHACGLLQFSIASSDVSGIRISSTDGTGIAGDVTITFSGAGLPVISEAAECSIAVQPHNAAAFEPGDYNVCLAPCALSSLKIDIRRVDGEIGTYTSHSPIKIERALRTVSSKAFDTLGFTTGDQVIGSIIRADHPRIFFNSSMIPLLRDRADGIAASYKASLLDKVNKLTVIPTKQDHGDDAARAALAYLLTDNPRYLNLAKLHLAASIEYYTAQTDAHLAVDWYSFSRINALCAYDWIYNGLTDEERRSLIVPLVEHVELVQSYSGLDIDRQIDNGEKGGFYGMNSLLWFSGLAAYNDGYTDALAEKHLRSGFEKNRTLCSFRNESAGDDGALVASCPNYPTGHYPLAHFNFFFSYESATGENIAPCYPKMALFPQWVWWTWIRDVDRPSRLRYCGFGDSFHGQNAVVVGMMYLHLTNYVHFFKDVYPEAARLAATLRHRLNLSHISDIMPFYAFLLDPEGEDDMEDDSRFDASTLKARHFENLGQVLMRTGWNPDATYVSVSLGDDIFVKHKHYDQNSFTIYYKDHLALDTGCRGNGSGSGARGDYNLVYYYAQSVAHNMVLIHKPGESVPTHWGDKLYGRNNYGGIQDYSQADVLAFETNDRFTYLGSDATKLYNSPYSTKCSEAVRQFVFIYPDCLVVYDRVGATDPSYAKEWLLHFQNKPVVSGNVTRSDTGFDSARLFCQTFLPEGAVLNLRGGEGNEFWAGENFPIEPSRMESYLNEAAESGRGPYTGAWRLEVQPAEAAESDRFLNVLTPCDASRLAPTSAKLVKNETCDGVELNVGGVEYKLLFNREGRVGGTISIGGVERPLSDSVQPQSGILY